MKTARKAPAVAFPQVSKRPTHHDLLHAVGPRAAEQIGRLTAWLESHEGTSLDQNFTTSVGWYEVASVRQRGIFYLMPKHGNFTLNLIVNARTIMSLVDGPQAGAIAQRLIDARRFPEGTLFTFDRHSFDAELVIALCNAKLRHH